MKGTSPALISGISVKGKQELSGNAGIIINSIALSYDVNIATFTTLSESIYLYPLGNKIGKALISGMAFPTCSTTNAPKNAYTNVEAIMNFYNTHKASNFENVKNPITITIGSTSINGYLESMKLNITSQAKMFGFVAFDLGLSVLPSAAVSTGSNP